MRRGYLLLAVCLLNELPPALLLPAPLPLLAGGSPEFCRALHHTLSENRREELKLPLSP